MVRTDAHQLRPSPVTRGRHPAAEILTSQPGPGPLLGARVLAEFADDPHRYASAKARKNRAGASALSA
ncbi:hypothetical protein PJ985_15590 [Streptomyces sp. ACA25]|uniref:hypothetical protein n=1 Tax=Streptomyces sp. ACA25 TaxID=3022596 RepID=UPI002306E6A6|nr:hypothetical protein [Streptomyces sp. ACA25]MDB1088983.1 hypothetical protein [Streptomyces sp. ACA25]